MKNFAMSSEWTPPPSLLKVTTTIGATLAALTLLAALGFISLAVAIGATLLGAYFAVDCYQRGEQYTGSEPQTHGVPAADPERGDR